MPGPCICLSARVVEDTVPLWDFHTVTIPLTHTKLQTTLRNSWLRYRELFTPMAKLLRSSCKTLKLLQPDLRMFQYHAAARSLNPMFCRAILNARIPGPK